MAGLQWFELDTDFHDDPKIKALQVRLRQPLADAYVSRLYAYCYSHLQERFAPEVAVTTIEDACGWRGRLGTLFDALLGAGVLDREAGMVVVHGVKARLGPHIAHRVAAADRQRRRRDRIKASPGLGESVTGESQSTSRGTYRGTSRPPMSMSMSGSSRSDGTRSNDETRSTVPSQPPTAPLNGKGPGLDDEAQALLRLLPAKAVDVATSLGLPRGAVDSALEELRGRGLVRLSSGMVPQWERA